MLLLRLVTTALCATCVAMLVTLQLVRSATPPAPGLKVEPGPCLGPPRSQALTVVDVAAGVTASQLGDLLHLNPGERITAINDQPLTCSVAVAEQIADRAPRAGGYLDLTVTSEMAERRILILMH
ncbi:MAG TPA: S1C family serine protease [Kofleriaceae bacterium]